MTTTEIRYGARSVNHDRVRLAMAEVGKRLEAERRQRVTTEHAEIVARGGRICGGRDWRLDRPCEWAAEVSLGGRHRCWWHVADLAEPEAPQQGHDYGPHRPDDAPTEIEVWRRRCPPWPREYQAPIAPALLHQREQMNRIAYRARRSTP